MVRVRRKINRLIKKTAVSKSKRTVLFFLKLQYLQVWHRPPPGSRLLNKTMLALHTDIDKKQSLHYMKINRDLFHLALIRIKIAF